MALANMRSFSCKMTDVPVTVGKGSHNGAALRKASRRLVPAPSSTLYDSGFAVSTCARGSFDQARQEWAANGISCKSFNECTEVRHGRAVQRPTCWN